MLCGLELIGRISLLSANLQSRRQLASKRGFVLARLPLFSSLHKRQGRFWWASPSPSVCPWSLLCRCVLVWHYIAPLYLFGIEWNFWIPVSWSLTVSRPVGVCWTAEISSDWSLVDFVRSIVFFLFSCLDFFLSTNCGEVIFHSAVQAVLSFCGTQFPIRRMLIATVATFFALTLTMTLLCLFATEVFLCPWSGRALLIFYSVYFGYFSFRCVSNDSHLGQHALGSMTYLVCFG